jgi:N-hydroxyarylamine O-acetyltransferase
MELRAYLDRIDFSGVPRADLTTLKALHRAHLRAITYENINVQLGRPMPFAPAQAYELLVERRRGGWCYQMNGVFGWALGEIGFDVRRLAGHGPNPNSHLVLKVELDEGAWIADVGYSDGPVEPFPLVEAAFEQRGFDFRVELIEDGFRLHNHRFGMTKSYDCGGPNEAGMMQTCGWLQTAPESPFVQHLVLAHHTEAGLVTLVDRTLREITAAGIERRLIEDAGELVETLQRRFGIEVPEAAGLWPALCERHESYLRERAERTPSAG